MELGDVKEYLSPEMGLIQLRHSGKTVLFHLNQVWRFCSNTEDQSEASSLTGRPIREEMEASKLSELLPISTGVRVSHRQLPASPQSPLRSQALMVTRTEERDEEDVPEEFIEMFSSHEERAELVEELNELHDVFKKIQYTDPDSQHVLDYHERLARMAEEEDFDSEYDQESEEEGHECVDDDEGERNSLESSEEHHLKHKTTVKNMTVIENEIEILSEELKPKDLRSLIGAYFDILQKQTPSSMMNDKFDFPTKLQQISRIKKPLHFFEDFCLALYRKCKDVRKGFKVEATFVSQAQVNLVLKQGHNILKEDLKTVRSF